MRLIITRHARDQMIERGIDEEQIKIAILRGAKIVQTDGCAAQYTYIRVAYRIIEEDTYKIKSVMVE